MLIEEATFVCKVTMRTIPVTTDKVVDSTNIAKTEI